ncbi:MAG: 2-phospho-L-lactate transferase CofD family protein, partial [Rubrobacteraceae bacterium]
RGETLAREVGRGVSSVSVEPAGVMAPPGVISAVERADVVVLSAGSLFTSTIPALLGLGVPEALAAFSGPVLYVANVMTQPGETDGFVLSDHLRAITDHVGPVLTDVLVHGGKLSEELVVRYAEEGASPVHIDREAAEALGVRVRESRILAPDTGGGVRHDPNRLAEEVCEAGLIRL